MIVRGIDDAKTVEWGNGVSRRFLTTSDGMGYTLTDTMVAGRHQVAAGVPQPPRGLLLHRGQRRGRRHATATSTRSRPACMYALDSTTRTT